MKFITLIICVTFLSLLSNAQEIDSMLRKKISVSGFCLCKTTLSSLKQTYPDLKEVDVEEMDNPKSCLGQDSRYIPGTGYSTDKQPGIIFQKDQETDQISKIRLNKQFRGYLPNGKFIDMGKTTLRDIANLYPELKDKWGSRGCSDYWNFSNDTISLFVKIDPNKKPQFPIDETYYQNKPIEGIDLLISCYSLQKNTNNVVLEDDSNDPILFLDSVRVNKTVLSHLNPDEISSFTVYKDIAITNKLYLGAKHGLIYIETKDFARHRYWEYFRLKSAGYAKLVPSADGDSTIQYILNKKVLNENFEADLAAVDDKVFKSLTIINKAALVKEYNISGKNYGVVIITNPVILPKTKEIPIQLR